MICEECGEETLEGYYKLSGGLGKMVCPDCKGWKGTRNPFVPVTNSGMRKKW